MCILPLLMRGVPFELLHQWQPSELQVFVAVDSEGCDHAPRPFLPGRTY